MLYNRCTGIYKFGNNNYPWRRTRRSNLGHIFREKKCVLWAGKYGNTLLYQKGFQETVLQWPEKHSGNAEATPSQSLTFSFVRVI